MQLETLDAPALINYINALEIKYNELEVKYNQRLKESEYKYQELKERYDLLIYKRFVRSAEQLLKDDKQLSLFTEEGGAEQAEPPEPENQKQEIKSYTRKKAGRKPIDPNIPRVEKVIDIPEEEKVCACGTQMTRIGEETSEKVQIIPPSMYVEKTIRPKYACRCCEGTEDEDKPAVRIAPLPPVIIPRSIASASLLSYCFIQKYNDHLPFYRQEAQFHRIGIKISRQDMCNWQQQVYAKLFPLFALMKRRLKAAL